MVLKTFVSEFLHIDVWFADQNSKLLEIEDRINITLVIKNIGKNISKSLNSKCGQNPLDHAKQSATDAFKTFLKRAV